MVVTFKNSTRIRLTPKYRFMIATFTILVLMLAIVSVVYATTTPTLCDDTPKYHCSKVTYTPQGGNVLITQLNFKGAIDGGGG